MRTTLSRWALIAVGCASCLVLQSGARGAWTVGWADKFHVAGALALIKDGANQGVSSSHFTNTIAWDVAGLQTQAGRANAREQVGYSMIDRSDSKCGVLRVQLLRYRKTVGGWQHGIGSACPVWTNYTWEKTATYDSYTCNGGPNYWEHFSSYIGTDHAQANTYLPAWDTWWQYLTQTIVDYGVAGDGGQVTSFGCHSIYWDYL